MTKDGHQPLNLDRPLRGRIDGSIAGTIGNPADPAGKRIVTIITTALFEGL
jgi:hypothetical protein